jgi:putative membrane protein
MNNKTITNSWASTLIFFIFLAVWLCFYFTALDKTDWWIENILVFIFAGLLFFGRNKFQFSTTALLFIFAFAVLHIYGAKSVYTKNELGFFLQNNFSLKRNPYDRIVHFSFGFLLLYPFVEFLHSKLKNSTNFILLFANMAIFCFASSFELIEWGVAAFTDKVTGETYVATQGDVWDAQKDIILAVMGALIVTVYIKIKKPNFKSLA